MAKDSINAKPTTTRYSIGSSYFPQYSSCRRTSFAILLPVSPYQELSLQNKENKRHQKELHTAGSKTFAQHANKIEEENGVATNRTNLYISTHTKKDGTPVNEKAAENIGKMKDMLDSQPGGFEENSGGCIVWSPNDIYSQVINKPERHGRVRGVGLGPTPKIGSSSGNYERLRVALEEEREKDKETIRELQEKLKVQEENLQIQGDQLKSQSLEVSTMKEQMAFFLRQMNGSANFQVPDEASGPLNQAFPQPRERSSYASHENITRDRGNRTI